jgi:hypothetical protein
MYGDAHTDVQSTPLPRHVDAEVDGHARAGREPRVRAASLKLAIVELRGLAKANSNRSSRQALVANLVLLRGLGVDEDALDLVVQIALAQNVDEEMTAAVNYLASGFLLALLTLREEGTFGPFCHA